MDLLILGAGMGVVGGLLPNPLEMIALTQVALGRWGRAIFVLLVPPLILDAALLFVSLFFFRLIPLRVVHDVAYVGGLAVIFFAVRALWALRRGAPEEPVASKGYTVGGVVVALVAEAAAPGTWIYWLAIAGPILAEGRTHGYGHVVPFFAGGILGYYGAALISTYVMAWGAGLHAAFSKHLILAANLILLVMGISYLVRAYLG